MTNIGTIYPYSKPNLFDDTTAATENLTNKKISSHRALVTALVTAL